MINRRMGRTVRNKINPEKEGQSEYGNPEQLARMAQQQAAIRRQLQQLNSLLNSKGMGNAKESKRYKSRWTVQKLTL